MGILARWSVLETLPCWRERHHFLLYGERLLVRKGLCGSRVTMEDGFQRRRDANFVLSSGVVMQNVIMVQNPKPTAVEMMLSSSKA